MKRLLFLSLIGIFIIISGFKINQEHKNINKDKIEIAFTRQTGFIELVMIKTHLEKKKILIDYKKIEFDKNGELTALSFSVDCQDGFSGAAATEKLDNKIPFGFYRDYSPKAASPFGIGGL